MAKPQLSLKARALRYLSAREHSRQELARKLARYAQEGDDIDALLDTLTEANFMSEARFSESLVNRRAARFGNSRILSELKSHNIDADSLTEIKAGLVQDEFARARKFGTVATDANGRVKQMRFLLQRGFSHRAIQAAMRAPQKGEE